MNRIIRCPSCAAVFAVETHQLQAAHGWLRCGKCLEAFNGTGLDVPSPALPVLHVAADVAWPTGGPVSEKSTPRVDLDDLLVREDLSSQPPGAEKGVSAELMAFSEALATFKPDAPPLDSSASPPVDESKTRSRFFLYVAMLFAGLLLMGQLLFIQRHAMAALWPQSLAVLQNLCVPFACELKPLLDPKAVVIEGASFEQSGDAFILRWSLRNTGSMAVSTTSLELSLLDQFNNPILRRVFLSSDMQAPAVLAPGQVWSGSLALEVEPTLIFSQYRLLSFSP